MHSTDMRSRPVLITIIMLAWPTMLEQILQVAVQYVDSAMVGRLGAEATAAVGATTTVSWLIGSTVSAVGTGFMAYIARAWGAKRYEDAGRAAAQSVLAVLFCGLVFTAIPLSLARFVPRWMRADEAIQPAAARYFFILYCPMLFRAAMILFSTVLRATGDTRTPMRVNTGINIVNVIMNYLLIYGTHQVQLFGWECTMPGAGLGVTGAALASAISFVIGGLGMARAVWKHPVVSPKGRPLKPDPEVLRPVLRVTIPSALQRFATSFGYVAFASLINSLGTISLASHSVANTVESAFYVPGYGMQAAAAALSGNTYGMGDQKRMRSVTRTLIAVELVIMTASGGMLFLLANRLMRIFTPNEDVIALGTTVLRMVAWVEPVYGVSIILEGIFQGVGDTRGPFKFNVAGMWGVRILGTFLCVKVFGLGLTAAWGCMIAHNVFLGCMFTLRYLRGTWNPLLRESKEKKGAIGNV